MPSPTALELKEARTKEGGGMLLGKDGKETLRNKGQKGYKADRRNTWTWHNTNRKWQWQWQVGGIHSWSLWVLMGWKLARKHRSRMHLCTSFQESLTLTLRTFTSVKFLSDLSCAKSTGVWQGRISSSRIASWMFDPVKRVYYVKACESKLRVLCNDVGCVQQKQRAIEQSTRHFIQQLSSKQRAAVRCLCQSLAWSTSAPARWMKPWQNKGVRATHTALYPWTLWHRISPVYQNFLTWMNDIWDVVSWCSNKFSKQPQSWESCGSVE